MKPCLIASMFVSALLAACGPGTRLADTQSPPPASQPLLQATPGSVFTLDALPAQTPNSDGCALFLFTPRPKPRFVFFADIDEGAAKMSLNGRPVRLSRLDDLNPGGFFDSSATHRFGSREENFDVEVSLEPDPDGGPGRGRGVVRIIKDDGWTQIAPVSSVSMCSIS